MSKEDTSENFRKIGTMSVNTDREEWYKIQSVNLMLYRYSSKLYVFSEA